MTKQVQIFFTPEDEAEFSRVLVENVEGLHFLDDNVWLDSPDSRNGIEECSSGRAYLYSGDLEQLPTRRRTDGRLEGPVAGCVIQVLRSQASDQVLRSGRLAAGVADDDAGMRDFVVNVWKLAKRVGKVGVLRPDARVDKNYLVGNAARRAVSDGDLVIADRSVGIYYKLPA